MKRLLIIILSLFISFTMTAQVQMNLQQPPVKRLQQKDMLNIQVNNPLNQSYRVYLVIRVDEKDNGKTARYRTEEFVLPSGLKRLNPRQIKITDEKYFRPEVSEVLNRTNNFPTGSYRISLQLVNITDDSELTVSEIKHDVVNIYNQAGKRLKDQEKWIQFYGNAYIEGQLASRQGTNQEAPGNYLRGNINAGIQAWTVPLKAHGFYSTENAEYRQNMNTFSISFDEQKFINNLRNELIDVIKNENKAKQNQYTSSYNKIKQLENINKLIEDPGLQSEFKKLDNLDNLKAKINDVDLQGAMDEIEETNNEIRTRAQNLNYKMHRQKLLAELEAYRSISYDDEENEADRKAKINELELEMEKLEARKDSIQKTNERDLIKLEKLKSKKQKYNKLKMRLNKLNKLKAKKKQFDALKNKKDKLVKFKNELIDDGDFDDIKSFDINKLYNKDILKQQLEKRGMLNFGQNMLYGLEELEAGTIYPYYSPLVLNGIQASGVNIEWQPAWFYLAFTTGNSNRSVFSLDKGVSGLSQKFTAGKIGVGDKNRSHFYLTGLYAIDDRNSLENQDTTLSGQSNIILGSDIGLSFFNHNLFIEGLIAGSKHSRNLDAQTIEIENKFYRQSPDFIKPTFATSYGLAYDLRGRLKLFKKRTILSGYFRNVDPSYNSFGAPNLRSGINVYHVKLSQKIWDEQITASLFRKNESSSRLWLEEIMYYERNGGEIFTRIQNWPSFRVQYALNAQDAENVNQEIRELIINGSYGYPVGNMFFSNTASYNLNTASSESPQGIDYDINNYLFNHTVNFKFPLSVSLNINYIDSKMKQQKTQTWVTDLSASMQLFKKLNITAGGNYKTLQDTESRIGAMLEANYSFFEHFTFNLQFENNYYDNIIAPARNFEEYILRGRLSVSW